MTDVPTLLDGIKARAEKATEGPWSDTDAQIRHTQIDGWVDPKGRAAAQKQTAADIEFVKNARMDIPRLVAAIEAVAGLHKPVAIYELDEYGHLDWDDESKFVRNICDVCSDSSVTENLDDGNYDLAGEWGEVSWPCPTITAVVAALGGGE